MNRSIFDIGERMWSDTQRETGGRRVTEWETSALFPSLDNRNTEGRRVDEQFLTSLRPFEL